MQSVFKFLYEKKKNFACMKLCFKHNKTGKFTR